MAADEFNIDDIVAEVTGGSDTQSNVTVADGEASSAKSKSGIRGL